MKKVFPHIPETLYIVIAEPTPETSGHRREVRQFGVRTSLAEAKELGRQAKLTCQMRDGANARIARVLIIAYDMRTFRTSMKRKTWEVK